MYNDWEIKSALDSTINIMNLGVEDTELMETPEGFVYKVFTKIK